MKKEDVFACINNLQAMYDAHDKQNLRKSPCYESLMYTFLRTSLIFHVWKISEYELNVWIDLNGVTAMDDIHFIKCIANDAIDMMQKRYSGYLTPECIANDYVIPMKNLLAAIEECNSISS